MNPPPAFPGDWLKVEFHTADAYFVRTMRRYDLMAYRQKIENTPSGSGAGILLPETDGKHEAWVACRGITHIIAERIQDTA